MSVFISYRHKDRNTAIAVAAKLMVNKIEYYLDIVDEESRSTEDITDVITKNIKKSTHLLAIISTNTIGSWWVPFEIGQATITNRRICSYATNTNSMHLSGMSFKLIKKQLPEYLHKWPILLSEPDLEKFIKEYKADKVTYGVEDSRGKTFDSLNESGLTRAGAESFHEALKAQI